MTELRSNIAGLSTEQRSQLEKRLLQKRGNAVARAAIPCRKTFSPSPPSFTQRRLWFLDQFNPGSSVYNIPSVVRLEGVLDTGALAAALNALVARHETLRTVFGVEDGDPVQVIAAALQLPLPVDDLGHLAEQTRTAELQRRIEAETGAPFDLARGPLLRARLLRLDERAHVLVLTMHHIVSDGWSMGVLMRELSALYAATSQGQPSPLPALPVQYADYAIWQRDWLQGEVLEKQLSYWREQLKELPVLDLPTDRPRPAQQSFRGARLHFDLPAGITEALEKVSQRAGVTLFMTLLAAFQLLLQRYSGQDDIVVGTPIAGRNRVEVEGLIGFFANTLVLRTDLSGDPTFMALLGRVRDVALGAYTHQDLPFDKLAEELRPERDRSRNPLFQVAFALRNMPQAELDLPGINVTLQSVPGVTAKFDLTLSIIKKSDGFGGILEYNLDLFDTATAGRLAEHYRRLLAAAMADPDQPISKLSLLADSERRQLLYEWNSTASDYPGHLCIQQLFESQVARAPEALAVVCQDQQLSYAELNARANGLAHFLIEQGVGADTLVAVCLERSPDLIIAVLGILKAGGAYVPLDPGYPKERLAFMLEDMQAPVLITHSALRDRLSEHGVATVLALDSDFAVLGQDHVQNPEPRSQSHHRAYVIYTSGSTGQPKGAEISHSSLVNLVTWGQHSHALMPRDRATLIAGPAFDASVWEIWPALTAGASLFIPDEDTRLAPDRLVHWYADQGITVSYLPTPLASAFLEQDMPANLALRTLFTGGEALHLSSTRALPFKLVNLYGPTESTVVTTAATIVPEQSDRAPPIGRPISNTQVYILDERLQPVPIGVEGELYIGGAGLARGYLNRPELTAERFIANPLAGTPGERLYRSGDRVRYLADGNIEFLGRNDDQVKLRGFRIELGEIEATLRRHPQVQDSVVLVREASAAGKRLVAYVVAEPASDDLAGGLRGALKQTLPEYMVPSLFVLLESLPLTANGKVDKRALSALEVAQLPEADAVAPRTPLEVDLAGIWCELLGLERVGVHDNFFELGGHSLLATKGISRMNAVLNAEFPVVMFFEYPTIAEQASWIAQQYVEDADEELDGLLDELEGLSEEDQAALVFGKQER